VNACLATGGVAPPRTGLVGTWDKVRRRLAMNGGAPASASRLDWMPAAHYRAAWPEMDAFALPSFYDGRIRINLAGREGRGRVALHDYASACARIRELLHASRNPRTGEPVVERIDTPVADDPLHCHPTQADLIITWRHAPLAFEHPRLGIIGPAPYRRTGGHSGGHGVAWIAGQGIAAADHGVRSAFDVVPTIIDLLGVPKPPQVSGTSLLTAPNRT
jgi:predicted AlkP superfamily phosphohydrolase/phosphomutase